MEINLKRIDGAFKMESSNEMGHTVITDASPEVGGGNSAFRPMQLLLAGLGSCSSIDVIHIMNKQRQPLRDIQIKVTGDREQGKVPSLFTKIHVHFDFYGDVDPEKAEQAVRLSMEKYCSVKLILEKAAPIESSFTIHP